MNEHSQTSPAVSCRDVALAYDGHLALEAERLDIPAGAVTAVVGPNGSGKSTLLGAVAGLVAVRRGTLRVLGQAPGADRGGVAYVLQETESNAAIPLTVREVVNMGRYARLGFFRRFTAADHDVVDTALARLEISDLENRPLTELSGGERQRVYVAQGLAQEAVLLLLDEPATGLDVPSQRRIAEAVLDEQDAGRTVVYTTHDIAEAATADFVVLLSGRVVGAGSPDEALTPELLGEAYGGRIHVTPSGSVVLDDPHHRPATSGSHPVRPGPSAPAMSRAETEER